MATRPHPGTGWAATTRRGATPGGNGHPPKNRYGETLHPTRVSDGLRWARAREDAWLVEAVPRYHPDWAGAVIRTCPGLREVATWNLLLVLRRR